MRHFSQETIVSSGWTGQVVWWVSWSFKTSYIYCSVELIAHRQAATQIAHWNSRCATCIIAHPLFNFGSMNAFKNKTTKYEILFPWENWWYHQTRRQFMFVYFLFGIVKTFLKNPAYGRHQHSQPMRILSQIPFFFGGGGGWGMRGGVDQWEA